MYRSRIFSISVHATYSDWCSKITRPKTNSFDVWPCNWVGQDEGKINVAEMYVSRIFYTLRAATHMITFVCCACLYNVDLLRPHVDLMPASWCLPSAVLSPTEFKRVSVSLAHVFICVHVLRSTFWYRRRSTQYRRLELSRTKEMNSWNLGSHHTNVEGRRLGFQGHCITR